MCAGFPLNRRVPPPLSSDLGSYVFQNIPTVVAGMEIKCRLSNKDFHSLNLMRLWPLLDAQSANITNEHGAHNAALLFGRTNRPPGGNLNTSDHFGPVRNNDLSHWILICFPCP